MNINENFKHRNRNFPYSKTENARGGFVGGINAMIHSGFMLL